LTKFIWREVEEVDVNMTLWLTTLLPLTGGALFFGIRALIAGARQATQIENGLASLREDLEELKSNHFTNLQKRLDSLEEKVDGLAERLSRIEGRLN
jgi:predicted nuclease with TOPRIM domain